MKELLQVVGLNYKYGERRAVADVSFSVQEGECFGLLGPNGAGKSTTIGCVCGLLSNWTGDLRFGGEVFRPSTNPQDRKRVGVVPQELALYENLTARENLDFFAQLTDLPTPQRAALIETQLQLAGLSDRKRDLVRMFSGGMKRRLNLAVGLVHSPQLVLLDEPTVGIDPQSRNHIFDALEELKRQGLSILYTTHYMEEAQRLCDRIAIMNEGHIVAVGTPPQLAEQAGATEVDLEKVFLKLTGRALRDD